MPQWPCSIYSHKQTSVITNSCGSSFFSKRTVCCTMPLAAYAPEALASFLSGIPNNNMAGTPISWALAASRANSSGESWKTPGIAEMGRRSLRPGRTNNGRTNWPALSWVSRTNCRNTGDCRSRLGR